MTILSCSFIFFFFNDTATTEIYTLSLHDALPIFQVSALALPVADGVIDKREFRYVAKIVDGKNRLKHRLQSAVVTLARQFIHLQEPVIGPLLNFNQVRNLQDCRNFREVKTIAEGAILIRHGSLLDLVVPFALAGELEGRS